MSVVQRLHDLGIDLPEPASPVAAYVSAVQTSNLVFVSGQLPRIAGQILHPGKVGSDVTLEEGQEAARAAAIGALAVLRGAIGDLERVTRIVRLNGYVASESSFQQQSQVIDGASKLLEQVLGEAGRHSRIAVGVASLPLNAPVEVDLIAEVR